VLAALGVRPCESAEAAKAQFSRHGLCFLAAPAFHPALKNLAPLRKSLGRPTFLNLLGPLCNPARVKRQVIGVYDENFLAPVAEAARLLGKREVTVVCGENGLDEISPCGGTRVARLSGAVLSFETIPPRGGNPEEMKGGDPARNAEIIYNVFSGMKGSAQDIVCLNAAAGMRVAGMDGGFGKAQDIIARGLALKKLEEMRA
jgi:anthranilate phosphoribosyltransferase